MKKTYPSPDLRSLIPSVDAVLRRDEFTALASVHGRVLVTDFIQTVIEEIRENIGEDTPESREAVIHTVYQRIDAMLHQRIRKTINATGIILHTGLGRSVLPERAVRALSGTAGYVNLQMDLENGRRGKRSYLTERLLCTLTGAEAAMVVNNNAAATLLILTALCSGREVVVSRGQLIEIGGSFRLPDCIHQSGARLVEVGTTNRTHLVDYERALGEETAALLRVNPSNYRVVGFNKSVPVSELVTLRKNRDVLVIDDIGCGALVDLTRYGLPPEPTVRQSVACGADIVCFSGDKLIGGPQSGIIVGKKTLVDVIRKAPLARMLRIDKLTDIALEHTLSLFLEPDRLPEVHPIYRMLSAPVDLLRRNARSLVRRVERMAPAHISVEIEPAESHLGGGTLPGVPLPSVQVSVKHDTLSADSCAKYLRQCEPPVAVRIADDCVKIDMRTLLPKDDISVLNGIALLDTAGNAP